MVVGAAAQAGAWWFVSFREMDVWRVTIPVLAATGGAALAVGPPPWSPDVDPALAAAIGVGTGAGLYAATRAFVLIARPWRTFRRHAETMYEHRGGRPLGWALALSVVVGVPGEELFWRGLVQQDVAGGSAITAALVTWLGYVVVNVPSVNLAAVAAAVAGGAMWGWLGWWTGGVLAPLLSHAAWTAMMISFPAGRAERVA